MATAAIIGEIGGRLDIQLKVGTTVGPFLLKFQQSFTGFILRASARTRGAVPVPIKMTATLADPANFPNADWAMGQCILLGADKLESEKFEQPATMVAAPKVADWDLEAEDADGGLTVLLYGEIRSYLRLPGG